MHLGLRWHPAAGDVQLRHLAIVSLEDGQQVAGQILLVVPAQTADDGAVYGDVLGGAFIIRKCHKDIARVHVGVEEVVLKHLSKKEFDSGFG